MKTQLKKALGVVLLILMSNFTFAQNVEVDINLDIKHSVGGVSDFGRERHITMHSSLYENAWEGEIDKAEILFNEWDVQLGRDNGIASFLHQFSPEDENNRNHHDPDSLTVLLDFWKGEYEQRVDDRGLSQFKSEQTRGAIMGTNAHPTYPTLSYYDNDLSGSSWGRENGFVWMPRDIETSAEWVSQYMEDFFVDNASQEGVPIPEYWEVMNEPDFELNTGQFMMSSWEDIIEYHNLVAEGVREKLGSRAPKIGGMTWGLHDLFRGDGFSRFRDPNYVANFYGDTPEDQIAIDYARGQVDTPLFALPSETDWYQWDVIWKEFIDRAGENMDFYAVHFYDWPRYQNNGGQRRSGGHVEATLEMLEWYDVFKFGKNNRKPVIISEYGAVANAWDPMPHDTRYDWENLKPFSSMMMQFLERPDYVELSMPFHLLKAQFRDIDNNGDGIPEVVYHYKTLRDDDGDGEWEFSELTKWYELWDDVDGTRIDTKSSDPDIQVDSYVDGNTTYLILNNLQEEETNINLNFFTDNNNNPTSVRIKHLFLEGIRDIILTDETTSDIPSSVILKPEATMVLKYTYPDAIAINETSVENKFYGEPVSNNQRVDIKDGDNTFFVNNVDVPSNPSQTEAIIKMTVTLFDAPQTENGFLSLKKFTFNGVEIDVPFDWRGEQQYRSKWFGALEIPVPANLIQTNNTIVVDFQHVGEVNIVNLITWDFSKVPGRTNPMDMEIVDVTGITVAPTTLALDISETKNLIPTIEPVNATNKTVTWSSNDNAIATVNDAGEVTGITEGTTTITVTSNDGNFTATSTITVSEINMEENSIVIEAEEFNTTNGTFNDASAGGPGLGVNIAGSIINYVNAGDYAEYNINVTEAGSYSIQYLISTPSDNAQIQLLVDNIVATTDNIPNNGSWDNYNLINGSSNITLSAGSHTIRINASGSNLWQWNLDKIILTKENSTPIIPVIGISISPTTLTLEIGETSTLTGSVTPSNATNQLISYSSNNNNVATVDSSSGFVTAINSGTTTITATSNDGNFTASSTITVALIDDNTDPLIIEAEEFNTTNGTFNDAFAGGPGLGVNATSQNINYVNAGDYTTYNINVTSAGTYNIEYLISTPSDNAQIQILIDDVIVSTDNVPNNGQWDNYVTLNAANNVNLSTGNHTVRINATGSNIWQWNLDKITLTKSIQGTSFSARNLNITEEESIVISPNPVNTSLNISGIYGENIDYNIYNTTSNLIMHGSLENNTINVETLISGMYFIEFVIDNQKQDTFKFIKK